MIGIRAAERPEEDDAAIESAAEELERAGTAAIGEVTNTLAAVYALARHGMGGSIFHEVLGVEAAKALARIDSISEG